MQLERKKNIADIRAEHQRKVDKIVEGRERELQEMQQQTEDEIGQDVLAKVLDLISLHLCTSESLQLHLCISSLYP